MNNKFIIIICAFCMFFCGLFTSCKDSKEQAKEDENPSEELMEEIRSELKDGNYEECLENINKLRENYPKDMEAREECLDIERDAKIAIAQAEIERTDSALQITLQQINEAPTLLEQNMLRNKRDSLQIVFDVQCAAVRKYRQMKNGQ